MEIDLNELANRCEAATGDYDPVLCDEIHRVLPEPKCIQPPNYCASLDAAMTLVPEGEQGWCLRQFYFSDLTVPYRAEYFAHEHAEPGDGMVRGYSKHSAALALTAAALRARAASTPSLNAEIAGMNQGGSDG